MEMIQPGRRVTYHEIQASLEIDMKAQKCTFERREALKSIGTTTQGQNGKKASKVTFVFIAWVRNYPCFWYESFQHQITSAILI